MNDTTLNLSDATRQMLGDKEQDAEFAPLNERQDAGSRARAALKKRAEQAKHVMHNVYLAFSFFVLVFVAGLAAFVWQEYQKPAKIVTDIRPCYYKDPKTEVEITGTREYSYPNKNLFGFEYRQADQVTRKTNIDVRGSAMSITGLSSDGWWTTYVDQGERGIQQLKPANVYVVTMGTKTYIFQDNTFCR